MSIAIVSYECVIYLTYLLTSRLDDAREFVDVRTRDNIIGDDNASWRDIRLAATSIIRSCFERPLSIGRGGMVKGVGAYAIARHPLHIHLPSPLSTTLTVGSLSSLGVEGDLTVTVSAYDNGNIHCEPPADQDPYAPAVYESCFEVLKQFAWVETSKVFADHTAPIPGALILPLRFRSSMLHSFNGKRQENLILLAKVMASARSQSL